MINVWRHDISLNVDWIDGKLIRLYGLHSPAKLTIVIDGVERCLTIHGDMIPFYWNGANGVVDLFSDGPMWHDFVTGNSLPEPYKHEGRWTWDDGTPITIKQQAYILKYRYRMERRKHTAWRRGLAVKLWWKFKSKWLKRKGKSDV